MGRGKTRVAPVEENLVVACRETVPRSTEAALDLFDCASMGVQSMRGAACAQRHRLAVSRPRTICGGDICAACAAGAARLRLLEQFLPPPAMPYRTRRLEHRRAEDVAAEAGVRVPLALVPPAPRDESPAPEVDMKPTYEDRIAARKEAVTAPRVATAAPASPPPPPPPPPTAAAPAATKAPWSPRGVPAAERIAVGPCAKCKSARRYVQASTPEALRPWCSTCRGNARYDFRAATGGIEPTDDQVVQVLSGATTVTELAAAAALPVAEAPAAAAAAEVGQDAPAPAQDAAPGVDDVEASIAEVGQDAPAPAQDAAPGVDDVEASIAEVVHEVDEDEEADEAEPQETVTCEACNATAPTEVGLDPEGWHRDVELMLLCPTCWANAEPADPEDDDCNGAAAAPLTSTPAREPADPEDDCNGAAVAPLTSTPARVEYVVPAELARLQVRSGVAIPFGVTASHIQAAQARSILTDEGSYLHRGTLDFGQALEAGT